MAGTGTMHREDRMDNPERSGQKTMSPRSGNEDPSANEGKKTMSPRTQG